PAGPTTLNICTGIEPSSLYLHSDSSSAAALIRQAIYDGPLDTLNHELVPVILEAVPNPENSSARIEAVTVRAGSPVVDADGLISVLQPGLAVRPTGCRNGSCATAYTGGDFVMDQLVVTFTLKRGLTWSDGQPLVAADSVYAFQLDAAPETPSDKDAVSHTASYQALDERTIEWRGLPGHFDPDFASRFWSPLPEHAWSGLSPSDLLTADQANRNPLGWGPYIVSEWTAGDHITLTLNPNYWRAPEALPNFSTLNIRFIGQGPQSNIQSLQDGACDLLLPSTAIDEDPERLQELVANNQAQLHYAPSGAWQHLDFGIQPVAYDDGYQPGSERPNFFGAPEFRRALAQCIDRQSLIDTYAWGQGAPPNTYLAPSDPRNNPAAQIPAYDPAAASAALEALGWVPGQDGIRFAQAVANVPFGASLALTLHVADDPDSAHLAQSIQGNLFACGVALEIISGPPESIFAPGPEGLLFGRNFDLGLFAWPYPTQPACWLYQSEAIPGENLNTFPYGWGGWNLSGFSNPDYDAACNAAQNALPGETAYTDTHATAQSIFAAQLPALPLFQTYNLIATRPDFCGLNAAASPTLLQDIEFFGIAEWCQ
ncbi:MAG: hypothetical protein DWG76_05000, partial [Chloroflexi bacterium]|nr:hypothetical protein [Chloroflexota bacterium]